MSTELLYTSAPKGLRHGTSGFCTVLTTAGMPINVISRLEGLSDYRHLEKQGSPGNPVSYAHLRLNVGGNVSSVLSRVADYGSDYSGRSNKIAHHVVLAPNEAVPAGPAWVLGQRGVMRSEWLGQCETPATGPNIPRADQQPRICSAWKSVTGDAGWGGVIAEAIAVGDNQPFWVIYPRDRHSQMLELIDESIALLPANQRWRATFSTYAANIPPDVECKIRFVPTGTPEAQFAKSSKLSVDLSKAPSITNASTWVERARGVVKTETRIASPVGESYDEEPVATGGEYMEMATTWESASPPPTGPPPPPEPPALPPELVNPNKKKRLIVIGTAAGLLVGLFVTWSAVRAMQGLPILPGGTQEVRRQPPPPVPIPEPPPPREVVVVEPVFAETRDLDVNYDQKQFMSWVVDLMEADAEIPSPIEMRGKLRAIPEPTKDVASEDEESVSEQTNDDPSRNNSIDAKLVTWGGEALALNPESEITLTSVRIGSNSSGKFLVQQLPYAPAELGDATRVFWSRDTNDLVVVSEMNWRQDAGVFGSRKMAYEQSGRKLAELANLFKMVREQNKVLPESYKLILAPFLTRSLRDDDILLRTLLRKATAKETEELAAQANKIKDQLLEKSEESVTRLKRNQRNALLKIVAHCGDVAACSRELGRSFNVLVEGYRIEVPELKFHDSRGDVVRRIPLQLHFAW